MTINAFLQCQISELSQKYDVYLITNLENCDESCMSAIPLNVKIQHVPIVREISPTKDVKAFYLLVRLIFKHKFDLVHSISPKAGLLSAVAGLLAGTPHRLHTFTGQVWATKTGIKRFLLRLTDQILAFCTTTVLVDSFSQQEFLIQQNVLSNGKGIVLGSGSISGVDLLRFKPNRMLKNTILMELGFSKGSFLLVFLGRIKREKGVIDLVESFTILKKTYANLCLAIIGPDEENLHPKLVKKLEQNNEYVRFLPYTNCPERYLAAADLFVLPSYREGFGSVLIEAAACGTPAVASRIYGITDAVEDGVTGILFDVGSVEALVGAISKFANSTKKTQKFGWQAHQRAHKQFSQQRLTKAVTDLYEKLLGV